MAHKGFINYFMKKNVGEIIWEAKNFHKDNPIDLTQLHVKLHSLFSKTSFSDYKIVISEDKKLIVSVTYLGELHTKQIQLS